jgi:hypothetical protein
VDFAVLAESTTCSSSLASVKERKLLPRVTPELDINHSQFIPRSLNSATSASKKWLRFLLLWNLKKHMYLQLSL